MRPEEIESGLRCLLSPRTADGADCSVELYRYACGQASPEEAEAFRDHLASCPLCQRDLAELERLDDDARQKAAAPVRLGSRFAWAAAAACAIAAVLLAAVLWPVAEAPRPGPSLATKGLFDLHLAVQRGSRAFVAGPDERFEDGDALGFFYSAAHDGHLLLLFAGEQGRIDQVYPRQGWAAVRAGVQQRLPDGAVIEPGAGCEWLVALFTRSAEPPPVERVRGALQRAVGQRGPRCRLGSVEAPRTAVQVIQLRRGEP